MRKMREIHGVNNGVSEPVLDEMWNKSKIWG